MTIPDLSTNEVVPDIIESIRQCFDAYDLLSLPSTSTLQSLLLLLCCPVLSELQSPMMVTAACRMAISLGYHRPEAHRPILYWSCIAWARWEWLKNREPGSPLCVDVESDHPRISPDPSTWFGSFYLLLAQAEKASRSDLGPDGSVADETSLAMDVHAGYRHGQSPDEIMAVTLIRLMQSYLSANVSQSQAILESLEGQYSQRLSLRIEPFSHITRSCNLLGEKG